MSRYLNDNGICYGWKTGFIHGTLSAGAGALPPIYVSNIVAPQELNPLKPFSSFSNAFSFIFVSIGVILIIVFMLLYFINRRNQRIDQALWLFTIVIIVCVVSVAEQYLSCRLDRTHFNIQEVFVLLVGNKNINYPDMHILFAYNTYVRELRKSNDGELYELDGHYGETTCKAFVGKINNNHVVVPDKQYQNWYQLQSSKATFVKSNLDTLLLSIPYLKYNRSSLYLSAKKFFSKSPETMWTVWQSITR